MIENKEFKSNVFSMLMEDRTNALQVYNALNQTEYEDPELIEIVTLEKGISLSVRNDASFLIDMNLNIYEHQSTYNPNMPLRSLIYFSKIIEDMLERRDLFSRRLIRIPTPHFVVFYNGTEVRPSKEKMFLSAAFARPTEEPELELVCTVYNINLSHDEGFLNRCGVLNEYTQFVETVRRNQAEQKEKPIEEAIDECIDSGILADFLKKRRAEVLKAMTIDMTFERREELIREEEHAEGREEGISDILTELLTEGIITEEKAEEMRRKHFGTDSGR
ncbi:MAG: hypothetical protein IKS87_06620 [Lachnospiraceae bacterium]|nr:hypothetical protein [Lachnospiraceae bacterium]